MPPPRDRLLSELGLMDKKKTKVEVKALAQGLSWNKSLMVSLPPVKIVIRWGENLEAEGNSLLRGEGKCREASLWTQEQSQEMSRAEELIGVVLGRGGGPRWCPVGFLSGTKLLLDALHPSAHSGWALLTSPKKFLCQLHSPAPFAVQSSSVSASQKQAGISKSGDNQILCVKRKPGCHQGASAQSPSVYHRWSSRPWALTFYP